MGIGSTCPRGALRKLARSACGPIGRRGLDSHPELDWTKEIRLREDRTEMIKELLQKGKNVCYRSSGNSMAPKVKSGDLCEFEPFPEGSSVADSIDVWDVVFCAVQPKNLFLCPLRSGETF